MLFFSGKEDMGPEASLNLLDLSPAATIDEANQAYTYLHRMIDLFYRDHSGGKRGSRKEDMDLLNHAYESAIAYISDRQFPHGSPADDAPPSSRVSAAGSRDLHFTINVSGTAAEGTRATDVDGERPDPDRQTVDDALSITRRRLQEAEAALPAAHQAVERAAAAAVESNHRHEQARQARLSAVIAAKSAKSKALLMEIEAKRAMEAAVAAAKRARARIAAARQAASDARTAADQARAQVERVVQSEETAAAAVICAEDRLEKAQAGLQALTHALLTGRERMKLLQRTRSASPANDDASAAPSGADATVDRLPDDGADDRRRMLADLLAIESSLKGGAAGLRHRARHSADGQAHPPCANERRRHPRLAYPPDQQPVLCTDGRTIAVMDLSTGGMGLAPGGHVDGLRIVRGTIDLGGRRLVNIAGRVVRRNEHGVGLKLVTRIGDHLLDGERRRLGGPWAAETPPPAPWNG